MSATTQRERMSEMNATAWVLDEKQFSRRKFLRGGAVGKGDGPESGVANRRVVHMQHHRFTNHDDGEDPDHYTMRGPGWYSRRSSMYYAQGASGRRCRRSGLGAQAPFTSDSLSGNARVSS